MAMDRDERAAPETSPAVSPFGKARALGTALAALSWTSAVWTVANRFLQRTLSSAGYINVSAAASTLVFGVGALVLLVWAARATSSIPARGAFLVGAAGRLCAVAYTAVSFFIQNTNVSLLVGAVLMPTSQLALGLMFALLAISRENTRDARTAAWFVVPVQFLRIFAVLASYFATWMLFQTALGGGWVRTLAVTGYITLFLSIIADVLGGLCFLLLRVGVRQPDYPEKRSGQT